MALNNYDEDQFDQENLGGEEFEPEPQKPRGNRTFLIILGIVGLLFVLILGLVLFVLPRIAAQNRAAALEQAAQINANNTATAMAATLNAQFLATQSALKTPVAPAAGGAGPTKTPVVAIQVNTPMGSGGSGLSASELATVSALQTQMAARGAVTPAPTSTALPSTGFADEVGLPLMAGIAVILIVIIFLSRRLRFNAQ